jgi:hypothetical protein
MHHTLVLCSADTTDINLKRRRTVAINFTVRTSTLQAPYLFHQSQHIAMIPKVRVVYN